MKPWLTLFLLAAAAPALAQSAAPVLTVGESGITVRATRIAAPMTIDGRLDEAVYEQVPAITEYIQQEPKEGAPVSERTESWVMFDDANLYIVCRCWDTHPERIVANDMRRDSTNIRQNDNFGVVLDTFHDKRNGFLFYVSPVGGMFDAVTSDERINNADWNTVWEAKTTRFPGGWIAELAIPFKSLRYGPGREQVWGINLRRTIRAKNEYAYITPLKRSWGIIALFRTSAAATLVGLEVPAPGKNLEIKPSAISRSTTDLLARPEVRNEWKPDVGVDVKYGVTKSLTADFTYNTDFAQVEADEVQVNLTRFSLLFPEKRDFFLEGQGLFTFGGVGGGSPPLPGTNPSSGSSDAPTIFYSRRIGLESGRAVPIIGGGRLSGRAGKWTIGALNIASDEDPIVSAARTDFTVLRVRRDILRRSAIGALFTQRSQSTIATGGSELAGLDGNFSFFQNVYFNGFVSKSHTETKDGDDLSYRGQFNYASDRYGVQIDRLVVPANFNPEVGFLPRANFRRNFVSGRFSPRPAQAAKIRKFYVDGSLNYTTDNANHLESREAMGAFRIEMQNSDAIHLEYFRDYEFLRRPFQVTDTLRIPVGGYEFSHVRAAYSPGQQHRLSGTAAIDAGSFYDGTRKTASLNARLGVTPQLGMEPNISLNWIDRGGVRERVTATGARTTFTMTPRMFVAALVQYASSTTSLSTNLRFRWEYQPGSELFVVYTEGRDTLPLTGSGTALENRGFVVKINRLFRF
jgi:hypothetical protein